MPFKGYRGPLIILLIILVVILGIAALLAASSSPPVQSNNPTPTMPPQQSSVCSCTITSDLGVQSVIVTNLNTNSHTTVMRTEFPFSFNFTQGDVLSFNVASQGGFVFDAWFSNDGFFHNQNPYTLKATVSFTMEAKFTPLEVPNY